MAKAATSGSPAWSTEPGRSILLGMFFGSAPADTVPRLNLIAGRRELAIAGATQIGLVGGALGITTPGNGLAVIAGQLQVST